MQNKIISIVLVITMMLSIIPLSALAQDTEETLVAEGTTASLDGDDTVSYKITSLTDSDYVLTVFGSGALADYSSVATPWSEYANKITKVVVEEGIISLSAGSFSALSSLAEVSVALSVTSIDEAALPETAFVLKGYMNHSSGEYAEANDNVTFKASEIRLLAIGNSHTMDWSQWTGNIFSDLADSVETTFSLERVTYGGRGLVIPTSRGSHYNEANDPESDTYQMYHDAFAKTYDIVIIQDYHESTATDTNGGGANYADEIQTAVDWIHTEVPGSKIVWFADWADKSSNGGDLELSWNQSMKAVTAVQALSENRPDYIIPASTVLQNARTSYLGTTTNKADAILNWEGVFTDFATDSLDDFTLLERDTTHMSLELGRQLMGTAVIYHLINNFGDVISADADFDYFSCIKTAPEYKSGTCYWQGEFVDEYWQIIRESAVNSALYPNAVTDCSDKYKTDPFIAAYEKVKNIISAVTLPARPTQADMTAAYKSETVLSQLAEIELLDITADDIIISYQPAASGQNGVCTVYVDCPYGYSYPDGPIVSVELAEYGDTNGDANINRSDLVLLRRHLLNKDSVSNGADANGDGNTDILDMVLLNLYLDSIGGGNIVVTPLDQKSYTTRPIALADWLIHNMTKSGSRYTVKYNYPDPLSNTVRYPSYEADGVTPTKWKTTHDNYFTADGSAYVGGMAAPITVKNSDAADAAEVRYSVYTSVTSSAVEIEEKSLMLYVKHTYADGIKDADKKSMLLGLLIGDHYLFPGNTYYTYDMAAEEWHKNILPTVSNDLPISYKDSQSYVELSTDFEGWIIIPATAFKNNQGVTPTSITEFKVSPGTFGGVYGELVFGDICVVEEIDPTLNADTGAVSSNEIDLPSDFPFEPQTAYKTHSVTPLEDSSYTNYPVTPSWNMNNIVKTGTRYNISFKLPDPFASDLYSKDEYQAQYNKLFSNDGRSYIGGLYASMEYHPADNIDWNKLTANMRFLLNFSDTYTISDKSVMFYVDHSYDSDIADGDKKEIEIMMLVGWKKVLQGNVYYRYDVNKKEWTEGTALESGADYAPDWSGGSRMTVPADFEGWFMIPASSFDGTPESFNFLNFTWHALGGEYGNLTIGDICLTDVTDPALFGANDRAASTTDTGLSKDFPLAVIKPVVLGPQQ